jgi:hypothetical protein
MSVSDPNRISRGSALALPDLAIPEGQLANFLSGGGRIWPDIVFCTPPPGLGRKRISMPRINHLPCH